MSHSAQSLSLYIVEHTRFVLKTNQLSAANQNETRKIINFFSQSESSNTSPETSANQNRVLRHPRALEVARYSRS